MNARGFLFWGGLAGFVYAAATGAVVLAAISLVLMLASRALTRKGI